MDEQNYEVMQQSLVSIATELFRFQSVLEKAVGKLEMEERVKYLSQFSWFSKKVTKALEAAGFSVLNLAGMVYDPGMLRIILCNVGIETVVALHNEKEETEFALRINSALATAFSDISTLGEKLESECSILNKQLMVKNLLKQYQGGTRSSTGSGTTSNQPSRASGTGRTSYGTTGYSGTKKQSSHLTGNSGGGVAGVSHNSFSNQASRGGTSSAVKRTVTDNRPKRPFSGKRFAATIVIALIIFCIIASLIDSPSSKTTSSSSCSSGVTVSTPAPKPTPKPTHAYIHTHACTCSQIRTGILFRFVAFGRCVC